MNILIAPDSFKESLEAIEVCRAIESGFRQIFPEAHYKLLPMADGGEGTSKVLSYALGGHWKALRVHDPLMRPITAKYLWLAGGTAVIEVAEACGLHLLKNAERNPMLTSSYGVGELIADALDNGAARIIIGLGGSATNDGGLGMLMALGIDFYDDDGNALAQGGAQLARLQRIDAAKLHPKIVNTVFEVACDVTNPLCGKFGASAIFGRQKGANPAQVQLLDSALANFTAVCNQHSKYGKQDYQNVAGAGAAGGLGFALMTFCHAKLQSGFDTVATTLKLSEHIKDADLVITGEGKLDAQTSMGKVASGVSQLAKANGKPVIAICGAVDQVTSADGSKTAQTQPFDVVMPSIQKLDDIDEVLKNGSDNIETTAMNIAAAIRLGQQLSF